MEYPLRTLAMVAQVQAGMWRRNGYAVMNQVYRFKKSIFLCQLLNFSLKDRLKPQKERNILIARLSSFQSWNEPTFSAFEFQTGPNCRQNSFSNISSKNKYLDYTYMNK